MRKRNEKIRSIIHRRQARRVQLRESEISLIFRAGEKDYGGNCALEVVRKLETDVADYPSRGQSIRCFLSWSLNRLSSYIPPREMHLSDRMEDEELALHYLYLRDEYGAGKLSTNAETQA